MKAKFNKNKAIEIMRFFHAHGEETRIVGGAVRDQLMGREPADFDLATTALPERTCELAAELGAKAIPTGIAHGTVTLVYKRTPFEVTTLRRDVATDGRHAQVEYSRDFAADAARRDFTVNALYEDAAGLIHDYFTGQEDIRSQTLRFVGNASQRCQEDHLRILRLYRFWGQLGFTPDANARQAAKTHKPEIATLSQERITSELLKTLTRANNLAVYTAMAEDGVLQNIILQPEHDVTAWMAACGKIVQHYHGPFKAEFLLAQFYQTQDACRSAGKQYRLANDQINALQLFCNYERHFANRDDQASQMDLIDLVEEKLGEHQFSAAFYPLLQALDKADITPKLTQLVHLEDYKHNLRKSRMPLNGADLKDRFGFADGPELGQYLQRLRRAYRNEQWHNAKEGLALVTSWLTA